MSRGFYETAQICLNGHVINSGTKLHPEHNKTHCKKCGEATITQCKSCKAEIQGRYEVPNVVWIAPPSPAPNFCHECGDPYPWTQVRLEAARELAEEFDQLDEAEILALKETLDDLVRETPKTALASSRFKKLMRKAGKESYAAMKGI